MNQTLTNTRVSCAIFTVEGEPDTEVRLLMEPDTITFSIKNGTGLAWNSGFILTGNELQLSEALQYVSDVVGASVPGRMTPFVRGWTAKAQAVHETACAKGFWEEDVERNDGEILCLMHSEISEALEALREGNPPCDKVPQFSAVETELADLVIRVMDYAYKRGYRVAEAVEAKSAFNEGRPYKHGKEF